MKFLPEYTISYARFGKMCCAAGNWIHQEGILWDGT